MRIKRFFGVCGITIAVLYCLIFLLTDFGAGFSVNKKPPQDLQSIVDAYADSAVTDGTVIGAAEAVVVKDQEPKFFSYGLANFTNGTPVTKDTIFQLGSVTKIFTTALLGQCSGPMY